MLASEADTQVELLGRPEFAEGRAAFLERRPPDFRSV
jgi:2-(1,2-epoxy-1,2-dihydrophenyl)acetyl-CoA isomerase